MLTMLSNRQISAATEWQHAIVDPAMTNVSSVVIKLPVSSYNTVHFRASDGVYVTYNGLNLVCLFISVIMMLL